MFAGAILLAAVKPILPGPIDAWREDAQETRATPRVFALALEGRLSTARVAIVTGSTKGIGLGIARGLGERKYRVHISGWTERGEGSLEAAAEAIRAAGGECVNLRCVSEVEDNSHIQNGPVPGRRTSGWPMWSGSYPRFAPHFFTAFGQGLARL